jgi:hypothetical protein
MTTGFVSQVLNLRLYRLTIGDTNAKGFGFPKPFLIETVLLDLAFDDLDVRRQIDFKLIHGNRRVAFDAGQPHRR